MIGLLLLYATGGLLTVLVMLWAAWTVNQAPPPPWFYVYVLPVAFVAWPVFLWKVRS